MKKGKMNPQLGRGLVMGVAVALVFGLSAGTSHAASVNLNVGVGGGFGNVLNLFDSEGTLVTVRAFSYANHGNLANIAQLQGFATGLGVSNQIEGLNSPPGPHSTDNLISRDGILVEFELPVILGSATLTAWNPTGANTATADSDVTYWSGAGTLNTPGDLNADLLGAGTNNDTFEIAHGSARSFGFAPGGTVDWLFISARVGQENDGFKLQSLEYTVIPLPAAGWMGLSGLGVLAGMLRRRKLA